MIASMVFTVYRIKKGAYGLKEKGAVRPYLEESGTKCNVSVLEGSARPLLENRWKPPWNVAVLGNTAHRLSDGVEESSGERSRRGRFWKVQQVA